MRLLLDSHVALWWLAGSDRVGVRCMREIQEADDVLFSPVSPWELGIKRAAGKLAFPDGFTEQLRVAGCSELPVDSRHAELAASLPAHHRDPFDRMLIAQAMVARLTLVTADLALAAYDVDILDATS